LNSNFSVLHDHRAALEHVVEQPAVVGTQVLAPLVGAHAGDDGVEARQVAPGQVLAAQQLHLRAQLLDRGRHLVADAHDIADQQVRRRTDVDHLERRLRGVVDVVPRDVRVFDHLIAAVVGLAAGRQDRLDVELTGADAWRGLQQETHGL
jgi:hypothetical protein